MIVYTHVCACFRVVRARRKVSSARRPSLGCVQSLPFPLLTIIHTLLTNTKRQIAFAPAHMVPGIEPSPDKMLQGRLFSYAGACVHNTCIKSLLCCGFDLCDSVLKKRAGGWVGFIKE